MLLPCRPCSRPSVNYINDLLSSHDGVACTHCCYAFACSTHHERGVEDDRSKYCRPTSQCERRNISTFLTALALSLSILVLQFRPPFETSYPLSCMNMNMVNVGEFSKALLWILTLSRLRPRAPRDWAGGRRRRGLFARARCDVDAMAREKMVGLMDGQTAPCFTEV